MAYTFFLAAAFVAASSASLIVEPYDPNPQYSFGYDVQDPYTGDSHGQVETRNGDVVRGSYNLLEADGTRRVVEYSADANGFNAVVTKQALPVSLVGAPGRLLQAPVPPASLVRAPASLLSPPVVSSPSPFTVTANLPTPVATAAPLLPAASLVAPSTAAPLLASSVLPTTVGTAAPLLRPASLVGPLTLYNRSPLPAPLGTAGPLFSSVPLYKPSLPRPFGTIAPVPSSGSSPTAAPWVGSASTLIRAPLVATASAPWIAPASLFRTGSVYGTPTLARYANVW